ncbi:MAG: AMP-binding protein [Ilumatobacteraceae bacterium]|nr:AMP-binding protein [Ilumatobacteraceae bacterium]
MATAQELLDRIAGQNVPKRFLRTVANHPDATVVKWKASDGTWASWTLTDLLEHTALLTSGLRNLGVEPGDRIVLMLRNRAEFHALDLAAMFCGATPISIYNSSAPDQVSYLVNHSKAKVAIVEDVGFYERFAKVRDELTTLQHIVILDDPDGLTGDATVPYAQLLEGEPADLTVAAEASRPDDLATVIYTSGTTGPPKGVMLTHQNVCWTLESIGESMRAQTDLDSLVGKRYVSYLPMAHIFERLLGHYYLTEFATEVVCCPDTGQLASYTSEVHPNVFIGVPRVWEKMYNGVNAALAADPERKQKFDEAVAAAIPIAEKMAAGTATQEEIDTWSFLDAVAFSLVKPLIGLDQAEICISGAAPLSGDILQWFRAIGVPLSEGYGMSETTAVLTWSHRAKPGYVGQPQPGIELRIAEDGEVLARGANMFPGYLDEPGKTAETIDEEGWVHTGDIGEIDDEGYLRIVDRKKELIITAGGKNVSPANLEAALKGIPLVGQACAVGDGKPFVAALVVLDPDTAATWAAAHGLTGEAATPAALAEHPDVIAEIEAGVAEVMSEFNNAEAVKKVKVLGDEWLADSDLLTPTSKLKRRGIHARFADEIAALYA